MKNQIVIEPGYYECDFVVGTTVLEVAIENKISISHSCEGMGTCGTCRVFIEKGFESLPPRNEIEKVRADDLGYAPNERQACQIPAVPGLKVRLP